MQKLHILVFVLITAGTIFGQDLSGVKICIDPGHGGHESDDRHMEEQGFWESESNLTKALFLDKILTNMGATVILTRDGNDGVADDPSLSTRVGIANENNVDYFNSVHSNAFNGETNYTLAIFNGETDDPTYPLAKEMAQIIADKIHTVNRTTNQYAWGDLTMHPDWTNGYGVLYPAEMPATISEGSFHDYIPETWRLMNLDYRRHESWAIARAFLDYFEAGQNSTGIIAGILRDQEHTVDYQSITFEDSRLPVNNITVTLEPGNQIYAGNDKNNGFYMFDSLAPGEYKLIFDAPMYHKDSVEVTVVANQTSFGDNFLTPDSTFVYPPATPQYVRIENTANGELTVECEPSANAKGYIFWYSNNGLTYSDSLHSKTNKIVMSDLENMTPYYFQIQAYNEMGESERTDECYVGIPSENPYDILIVNGFDRSTNTRHDYVKQYGLPLISNQRGFSFTLNESVYEGKISLSKYKNVIWMLGDESTADDTFNPAEQDSVENFLNNGGNFFVSGAEIGWDLVDQGTLSDKNFYNNFLKASYINDAPLDNSSTYYTAESISGSIMDGIGAINYDDGSHGTIDVDWPDAISPLNGAQSCLKFQDVDPDNGVAGIYYDGQFPDGDKSGRLVYLTFPIETVYDSQTRTDLMERILNFFDTGSDLREPLVNTLPEEFALKQNFPNPFNPVTKIEYNLPQDGFINLKIFDVSGRLIETLVRKRNKSGFHSIQWNASRYSSGVYIYRLEVYSSQNGNLLYTNNKKCMLIK
ncbi:MAG: N-acetylmuramoyl-L-alanine amidase [Candidatus Marinimicrobia bacterium]|nr:N-acetylmuramoyl-L-alanine amidase [Candidatus Neomarinimicrobiota bacterium]